MALFNFSSNNTDDEYKYIFPDPMSMAWYNIFVIIVEIVVTILTVVSNVLVVIVIAKTKSLHTPFNIYIFNLSFADSFIGIAVMPLIIWYNYLMYWNLGMAACWFLVYFYTLIELESVMSLCIISVDRLWSVQWSIHYRQHRSLKMSFRILACSWLFNITLWTPAFLYDRLAMKNSYDCGYHAPDPRNQIPHLFVGTLGYILPLTCMISSYIRIAVLMYRRKKQVDALVKSSLEGAPSSKSDHSGTGQTSVLSEDAQRLQKKQNKEMKTFILLGHIILVFLICWIPFYMWWYVVGFFPHVFSDNMSKFSWFLADSNSMFNPIMYTLSNEEIRSNMKALFQRKKK